MKTKGFLKQHSACIDGARWALSISEDMADVWDAMIEQGMHDWLVWTATRPGVFSDSVLRKLACRFVRETPLHDGRKVWDLLVDERSRIAIEVAERYADGKATAQELDAARVAAYDAARIAHATARAAYAYAAARDADRAADRDAAYAAAVAYAADAAAAAAEEDAADDAPRAAAYTAYVNAYDAAHAVACATRAAAYTAAADNAAKAAQVQMIAEMGNPFKER
jgi:hypothetical protein